MPIQNSPATVQNDTLVDGVVNETVRQATQKVFENVVKLDNVKLIADDIAALLVAELKNASFMTIDLELTDAQREKLVEGVGRACTSARDKYIGKLKKDARTKSTVEIVERGMRNVVEEALSAIGQEVNRGTILSATAVSANAKKEDYNSIELNYSKMAGDITIPTKGIFIATNCVELIQNSCTVIIERKAAAIDVDPETGEVLSNGGGQ